MAQEDKAAREAAPKLEGQLTREQLAEGQQRAGEFKPTVFSSNDVQQDEFDGNAPADLLAKAEAGDVQAQNELGEAFQAGKVGVTMDPVRAAKWFRRAADQNYAPAQSNLGLCYERGNGVAKYEVEAYKWYLLAAAQGDHKAKSNATLLELMKTNEQITEGKRRAQVWLERFKAASPSHADDGDFIESKIQVTQPKP
jgi:TPR repeat protein